VSPVIALAFMCGVIALLTGAARGIAAVRTAAATPVPVVDDAVVPAPVVRHWLPSAGWGAVALYGLVLASAGMLLAR
jgi:hypothetical protein